MDELKIVDLCITNKYLNYSGVEDWNRTRSLMLMIASPYLKDKKTTVQKILPLPIDEESDVIKDTYISDEDVKYFKENKDAIANEAEMLKNNGKELSPEEMLKWAKQNG